MPVQERVTGNEYRTTIVCVDSCQEDDFSGRLYNPYWKKGREFHSVMQLLMEMESLLDQIRLPQSFTAKRSFVQPTSEPAHAPADEASRTGRLGTFILRVVFRQNASWQGALTWVEGHRTESFRSVLELLLLMHGALEGEEVRVGNT